MSSSDVWVLVSLLAGFAPNLLLLWQYGFLTRWEATLTGRTLFSVFVIVAITYALQIFTLIVPGFFHSWLGVVFRVSVRLAIAVVMLNMYRVFRKAQRSDRRAMDGDRDD